MAAGHSNLFRKVAEFSPVDWLLTGEAKNATDRAQEEEAAYLTADEARKRKVLRSIHDLTTEETDQLLDYINLIKKHRK